MHRIKFNDGVEVERVILSYYNSISFAFTEICGRSYDGGVLEILPGEVGNIPVPVLDNVPMELVKEILKKVDEIVQGEENNSLVLIVGDAFGISIIIATKSRTCNEEEKEVVLLCILSWVWAIRTKNI